MRWAHRETRRHQPHGWIAWPPAGVRFDRAHAHNVVTLPSHANILSGRYPFVHGVRDNAGFRFPDTVDTLATVLKGRGYRTGAFVSAFPLEGALRAGARLRRIRRSVVERRPTGLPRAGALGRRDRRESPDLAGTRVERADLLLGPPVRAALSLHPAGALRLEVRGQPLCRRSRGGRRGARHAGRADPRRRIVEPHGYRPDRRPW